MFRLTIEPEVLILPVDWNEVTAFIQTAYDWWKRSGTFVFEVKQGEYLIVGHLELADEEEENRELARKVKMMEEIFQQTIGYEPYQPIDTIRLMRQAD